MKKIHLHDVICNQTFFFITCNRNVIDYIHFDPVIMITFRLHLDYFSSFCCVPLAARQSQHVHVYTFVVLIVNKPH
jgi:hypothetical protein